MIEGPERLFLGTRITENVEYKDSGKNIFGEDNMEKKDNIEEAKRKLCEKVNVENNLRIKDQIANTEKQVYEHIRKLTPKGKSFVYFRKPSDADLEWIKRIGNYHVLHEKIKYKNIDGRIKVEDTFVTTGYSGTVNDIGSVSISARTAPVTYVHMYLEQEKDYEAPVDTYYFFINEGHTYDEFVKRYNFAYDHYDGYNYIRKNGEKTIGNNGKRATTFNVLTMLFSLLFTIAVGVPVSNELSDVTNIVFRVMVYASFVMAILFIILFIKFINNVNAVEKSIAEKVRTFKRMAITSLVLLPIALAMNEPHFWIDPSGFTGELFKDITNPTFLLYKGTIVLAIILATISFIINLVLLIKWIKNSGYDLVSESNTYDRKVNNLIAAGGIKAYEESFKILKDMVR